MNSCYLSKVDPLRVPASNIKDVGPSSSITASFQSVQDVRTHISSMCEGTFGAPLKNLLYRDIDFPDWSVLLESSDKPPPSGSTIYIHLDTSKSNAGLDAAVARVEAQTAATPSEVPLTAFPGPSPLGLPSNSSRTAASSDIYKHMTHVVLPDSTAVPTAVRMGSRGVALSGGDDAVLPPMAAPAPIPSAVQPLAEIGPWVSDVRPYVACVVSARALSAATATGTPADGSLAAVAAEGIRDMRNSAGRRGKPRLISSAQLLKQLGAVPKDVSVLTAVLVWALLSRSPCQNLSDEACSGACLRPVAGQGDASEGTAMDIDGDEPRAVSEMHHSAKDVLLPTGHPSTRIPLFAPSVSHGFVAAAFETTKSCVSGALSTAVLLSDASVSQVLSNEPCASCLKQFGETTSPRISAMCVDCRWRLTPRGVIVALVTLAGALSPADPAPS